MPQLNNMLSSPLLAATTAAAGGGGGVVKNAGDSALSSVQWFGSLVSRSANQPIEDTAAEKEKDKSKIDGTGGSVYNRLASTIDADENKERQVWAALANLEKDSKLVDDGVENVWPNSVMVCMPLLSCLICLVSMCDYCFLSYY